jgi:sugar O-acyltransferase (sialic acid O-acetyltransferase NeuD family)
MVLAIYGSGGLGREVLDLARFINQKDHCWTEMVFINDFEYGKAINDTPVLPFDDFINTYDKEKTRVVIATGEPAARAALRQKVTSQGYELQTLIHPNTFVGSATQIGRGAVIRGGMISCNATIEENVFIQTYVTVGHDVFLGADSVLSDFVVIGGESKIGRRVYIGLSTPVKDRVTIGDDTIVGMASAVARDLPENVVALGNPARPMKNNDEKKVFK